MRRFRYTLYALLLFGVVVGAFFLGRASNPESFTKTSTFYAIIEKVEDKTTYTVSGLEINDINHRGQFVFTVDEDTALRWGASDRILLSGFAEGDMVSITYNGSTELESATHLHKVLKLKLLDDRVY